jgi:hypothetical protein
VTTFDAVNRVAVVLSTVLLAAGLAASLSGATAAARLLDAGLIMLMLTPLLRLATTVAGDVRRRDRVAVLSSLAVIAILAVSWALALRR